MNENCLTEKESIDFLEVLFPSGLAGSDLKNELVPEGWEHSPYKVVFHPPPEQLFNEYIRMSRNLKNLSGKQKTGSKDEEEPDFEEFCKDLKDHPVEPNRELRELMGLCLWDVFSNNHEVLASDGRIVDLGSQRGAAGFIADWLNTKQNMKHYSYLDFYMGTVWISNRADLSPVYRVIFNRINNARGDWIYHFPQLYLVRPTGIDKKTDDMETYDPAKTIAEEIEKKEKEKNSKDLEEKICQLNRKAADEAAQGEPPRIVAAYRDVYGHFPDGWPPV
jgi:hypothetical protein